MNFQTHNDFFLNEDDIFISSNFKTVPIATREEKRLDLVLAIPNTSIHSTSYNNNLVPYSSNKYFSSVTIEEMDEDSVLSLETNINKDVSVIESIPKVKEAEEDDDKSKFKSNYELERYEEYDGRYDIGRDGRYKDIKEIEFDIEYGYGSEYDYIPKFENSSEVIFNYSDYIYDIQMNEKCATCSLDALTLIKTDEEMFHKFLKTDTPFQVSIFSLMKNIIQTLDKGKD